MRCALALFQVIRPDSIGSYDTLLVIEPLPGDEALEVWQGCLHDWAVAKLGNGDHRFGLYRSEVVPLDPNGRPDEDTLDERNEQDIPPAEEYVYWFGFAELVAA